MKKNSGLILILIIVLLVGIFSMSDNTASNGPIINGGDNGQTDIVVPPGGDDGQTDVVIPPTEGVEQEVLTLEIFDVDDFVEDLDSGCLTIQYEKGMTWGEWVNSEYNTFFGISEDSMEQDGKSQLIWNDGGSVNLYYDDGELVYTNELIDSSLSYVFG